VSLITSSVTQETQKWKNTAVGLEVCSYRWDGMGMAMSRNDCPSSRTIYMQSVYGSELPWKGMLHQRHLLDVSFVLVERK
jgi:hypothetical protein